MEGRPTTHPAFYWVGIILVVWLLLPENAIRIGRFGGFLLALPALALFWAELRHRNFYKPCLPTSVCALYAVYIFFFLVALNFNGDGGRGDSAVNSLLLRYFTCILIFLVLSRITVSQKNIRGMGTAIIALLVVDSAVTILQLFKEPVSWTLWSMVNAGANEKTLNAIKLATEQEGVEQILTKSFCPGLFPSTVTNGYFLACCGLFPLYRWFKSSRKKEKMFYGAAFAVGAYAVFACQQRTAFYLFLLSCMAICYCFHKRLAVWIMIGGVLFGLLYGLSIKTDELGRYASTTDHYREYIYSHGINYVTENLMWGGRLGFIKAAGISVHTILLNAFIYGGFLGGLVILAIFVKMCWDAGKILLVSLKKGVMVSTMFAYGLMIYNLISLTHNNSLLTGEPMIFIFYALMLRAAQLEKAKTHTPGVRQQTPRSPYLPSTVSTSDAHE